MPLQSARILNFDGSILRQHDLLERFRPQVLDLSGLGESARLWLGRRDADQIRHAISGDPAHSLSLLGSGDYHHISALLIGNIRKPVSVIVFDSHPDWDIMPPHLGCGSWVHYILRMGHVREVVVFGPCTDDISTFWIQTADLASFKRGRVRVYPYEHKPTRVFFNPGLKSNYAQVQGSLFSKVIHWPQLKGRDPGEAICAALSELTVKDVYVSIDKDCLRSEDALTNWDKGRMSLAELTAMLEWIKKNLSIIGADITGEYSECKVKGLVKNICSRFDHPGDFSAKGKPDQSVNDTNQRTNIRLLETLLD